MLFMFIYAKKNEKKTTGDLKDIFNNIINNLKLVDKFIKLFDEYIKQLKTQNKRQTTITNRKTLNITIKSNKKQAEAIKSKAKASKADYDDDDDDDTDVDDVAYCFVDMLRLLEAVVGGRVTLKAEARCRL